MKQVLLMIALVGCGTIPTEESVVGVYENQQRADGKTARLDLLKNGATRVYLDGKEASQSLIETKWKIQGRKVHVEVAAPSGTTGATIFRIEPNGDLTLIARMKNGEQLENISWDRFKKIE